MAKKAKGPKFLASDGVELTKRQDSVMGIPGIGNLGPFVAGGFPFAGGDVGFGVSGSTYPFYSGWGSIGLNGYGIPLGSFSNYWLMDRNPTVALSGATADAPIWGAEVTYECRPGVEQEKVDYIREQMQPWETHFLVELTRPRSDGFHAEELIFEYRDVMRTTKNGVVFSERMLTLKKPKPLAPEITQIKQDASGNVAGLLNNGTDLDDPRRFIHVAYDGRGYNPYGRSRKENFKKPWLRQEYLYDIMEYALNITVRPFGYISYPYGMKDANGNLIDLKPNAQAIGQGMQNGQFAMIPDPFAPYYEQMIDKGIDPSKCLPYKIGWYDTKSDHGAGFKTIMEMTDKGIVSGSLKPPRSILEGPGTQADAGTHTDSGVKVDERDLQAICRAVSLQVIDTLLVQNYGEKYRGAVWWKPSPLVDLQRQFTNDLVKQTLGGPVGGFLLKRVIDLANMFERSGVKLRDFDQEELMEDFEKEQQAERAMELKSKVEARKASLTVESTEPISEEEKRRRKAFLLALLAFFAWQAEKLVANPKDKANLAVFDIQLAGVLKNGMRYPAMHSQDLSGWEQKDVAAYLKRANVAVEDVAARNAILINETTAKRIQDAVDAGAAQDAAIEETLRKAIETRAIVIEDDATFIAGEIGEGAAAEVQQDELVWITKADEKVCPMCGPLHGTVVKAGEPFAKAGEMFGAGLKYPRDVKIPCFDTHTKCRCRIQRVPGVA